jgi:hypothetical protein
VGKGNIRERLLSHWNHENSTDLAIWNQAPYTFRFEMTHNPARREAAVSALLTGVLQMGKVHGGECPTSGPAGEHRKAPDRPRV